MINELATICPVKFFRSKISLFLHICSEKTIKLSLSNYYHECSSDSQLELDPIIEHIDHLIKHYNYK